MERAYREDIDYYEERAAGLLASATDGTPEALAAFEEAGAALTVGGSRDTVARRHGLISWSSLQRHLVRPARARPVRARLRGDRGARRRRAGRGARRRSPRSCPRAARTATTSSGWRPRRATSGSSSSCWRAARIPRARTSTAGRRCTRRATSACRRSRRCCSTPARPSTCPPAATAARRSSSRCSGATRRPPSCWRSRACTRATCAWPRASAVLDLVEELAGTPQAGAQRGFYRPHSGFPRWQPSDDPAEVVDEALAWAARNDRAEVLDALVAHGAAIDADVYRGTALTWAAACGRVAAIERLLALGADPERPLDVRRRGPRRRRDRAARRGRRRPRRRRRGRCSHGGADAALRDLGYHGTPADWAEHSCDDAELTALLREREGLDGAASYAAPSTGPAARRPLRGPGRAAGRARTGRSTSSSGRGR